MAGYEIVRKSSAGKDLTNIDKQYIPKIVETIESLVSNPFPQDYRKLHGSEKSYRTRPDDYRIIYQVDTNKRLIVIYHYVSARKYIVNNLP